VALLPPTCKLYIKQRSPSTLVKYNSGAGAAQGLTPGSNVLAGGRLRDRRGRGAALRARHGTWGTACRPLRALRGQHLPRRSRGLVQTTRADLLRRFRSQKMQLWAFGNAWRGSCSAKLFAAGAAREARAVPRSGGRAKGARWQRGTAGDPHRESTPARYYCLPRGTYIGSGPGLAPCEIAEALGPTGRLAVVEKNAAMLTLTERRAAEDGLLNRLDLREGDAAALPYPDGAFAFVGSAQVFEYVPDVARAVAEAYRVLRPGGRLALIDTDWQTLIWHADDAHLATRVATAWEATSPTITCHATLSRCSAGRASRSSGSSRSSS
jgi:SAM-dependent methyltransferase